jgi:hypothetical protein
MALNFAPYFVDDFDVVYAAVYQDHRAMRLVEFMGHIEPISRMAATPSRARRRWLRVRLLVRVAYPVIMHLMEATAMRAEEARIARAKAGVLDTDCPVI